MFRRRRDRDDDSYESSDAEIPNAELSGAELPGAELSDAELRDASAGDLAAGDAVPAADRRKPDRPDGPWDASETDLDDPDTMKGRLDLGALIVKGRAAMQLRLDVDPQSRRVRSVTFVAEGAALQLQAFAAPRTAPLWPDVRAEIAADCTRRGGQAAELDGPYGTELRVTLPVTTPEGKAATQSSRIVGVDGPRWLLRASYLGTAIDPDRAGDLPAVLRDVVVVRGQDPMAPRDMLQLRVPTGPGVAVAPPAGGGTDGAQPARPPLTPFRRGPEITEVN